MVGNEDENGVSGLSTDVSQRDILRYYFKDRDTG